MLRLKVLNLLLALFPVHSDFLEGDPNHCGRHGTRSSCGTNPKAMTASMISPPRAAAFMRRRVARTFNSCGGQACLERPRVKEGHQLGAGGLVCFNWRTAFHLERVN
jgi:hypothetical protein